MEDLVSAGAVAFRKTEVGLRFALMRSDFGTWVFPKGGIEPRESEVAAARREAGEEVGLVRLRLLGPLGSTAHRFQRGSRHFRKTIHWFLFRAPAGAELRPDERHGALDAGWFSFRDALKLLSHPDQRRLLRKAEKVLRHEYEDVREGRRPGLP